MKSLIWQVFKYGVIGVLATVINLVVSELFAAYVFPCLGVGDPFVRYFGFAASDVVDSVRAFRAVICNLAGFFVANVICWWLNRKYVFMPGRHSVLVEYLLFLASSGFAIVLGNAAIWALVRFYGVETTWSFMINVFVSTMVNFVVRKFIVFKG